MKISTLQSLISRTGNQIAEYEGCIIFAKEILSWCDDKWEIEQQKYVIQHYKARLPKLREIQKELKAEIREKLVVQRFRLDYRKEAAERRKTSTLRNHIPIEK